MSKYKTNSFYSLVRDELALKGIYIDKNDIYILVRIIFKCIHNTLINNKNDILSIDNCITIKRVRDYYRFKLGKRVNDIPGRLNISDDKNRKILENIFLPLINKLE